jgi:AmpD protein
MTNSSISQSNEISDNNNLSIVDGWLTQSLCEPPLIKPKVKPEGVSHCLSLHSAPREPFDNISLLVVHNISLPPGKFGSNHITDFFQGCLNKDDDPYFETIYEMQVSAHCLIRRDGTIVQYVSFLDKAWHAGFSTYKGRDKCNDYSIGIELEGTDDIPYTKDQYVTLACVSLLLKKAYPEIADNIVGHSDIAPGRKTDPGDSFNWSYFHGCLNKQSS